MAENKKLSIKINQKEFANLIVQLYNLNRSYLRLKKTIYTFARMIGREDALAEAYYITLKDEKDKLLDLLEKQLKKMHELNSPPFIMALKQQEIDSAKEIIGILDLEKSKILNDKEIYKLQDYLEKSLIDLTTNFTLSEDFPINLGNEYFDDDDKWKHDLIKS